MEHEELVFIDKPLKSYQSEIVSVLEAIEKLISQTQFFFFFSTESKSEELTLVLKSHLENIPETEVDEFLAHYESQTISFSWGHEEREYIFIIITEIDKQILVDPPALIGLLIHEIVHGLQRQRGLEDDLQRSLFLTIEIFETLASMIPNYPNDVLINMMKEIGQNALFVIKELYTNTECLERGYGSEVLAHYHTLFEIDENKQKSLTPLNINLIKDSSTNQYDINEFQKAYMVLLTLVPAWLPFLRVRDRYEKKQALEIRRFVNMMYSQVKPLRGYFDHLENIYLVDYTFTSHFHRRFFSEVFSIAIEFLTEGDFIIWQLSQLVEQIEPMVEEEDELDRELIVNTILHPLLKASFIFGETRNCPIELKESIISKMKIYLDKQDFDEWMAEWTEYEIEDMLLFATSKLISVLREKFLLELHGLRRYTRLVLGLTQILIDLGPDLRYNNDYIYLKQQIHKFITERDSRYLSLKIIYPLEFKLHKMVFNDPNVFTPEEASEFLILFRFFAIPKTNLHLMLGDKLSRMIKLNIETANSHNDKPDPQVASMTCATIIDGLPLEGLKFIIPLYRTVLISLNLPMKFIKESVKAFGDIIININKNEED
ncbi:MAG: hypothetical protein ACXAC7_00855 [Candidatus Hodarchaeales archaeon]|jgi:hypothetical protein